ncbi:MAG TPA: hypothetical protein VMM79_11135 [Longimicrobiales bacterium]|nr:hypothetical protein [Longimicrobiales bacterium]
MQTLIVILPVLVTALLACSDDPGAPMENCGSDVGSMSATVAVGQSVTIDWAPPCALALLLVELDASDQWVIASLGFGSEDPAAGNTIFPPVTYGVVPTGAIESEPPAQLNAGTKYDVALWRLLPAGSSIGCSSKRLDEEWD